MCRSISAGGELVKCCNDAEIQNVYKIHQLQHNQLTERSNSLKNTRSKDSGKILGSHEVFRVIALNVGEEVTEVAEEAVVNVWKLPEQISGI